MRRASGVLLAACLVSLPLLACKRGDSGKAPGTRPALDAPPDRAAVLATVLDDEKAPPAAAPSGLGLRPTGLEERQFTFSERGGGVAYVLERGGKFQVVHNGRVGKPYAAVGTIALSRDGQRVAYGALADGKWRMVVDGREGESFGAVQMQVFSPDGAHVAYQAMIGERWYLVVDRTVNGGTPTYYQRHEFGAGSSRLVYVEDADGTGVGRLVVTDLQFEKQVVVDERVPWSRLSADGSRIAAVSVGESGQRAIRFRTDGPDQVERGAPYDGIYGLAFGPDGVSLAYIAERGGKRFVVRDGAEAALSGDVIGQLVLHPNEKVVGGLIAADGAVTLRQFFLDGEPREAAYDEAEGLVYSEDGRHHAYAARKGARWFVVVDGKEGPGFDRVVSPAFSPEGKVLVYRARQDGKRFVVTADANGKTVRQHPPYEQVFQVLFTADGKSAAYGVKDGRQLAWKVEAL